MSLISPMGSVTGYREKIEKFVAAIQNYFMLI